MLRRASLPDHVRDQLQLARNAGLDKFDSDIFELPLDDPNVLCQLFLDVGISVEGLEAFIADELNTTEACASVEDLETELEVFINRRDLCGVLSGLWPMRTRPPPSLPVSSLFYVQFLDGSLRCRSMTVSNPAINMSMQIWGRMLWTMRRISWCPERHSIFPWWFQCRIYFLSWIGRQLGLQPMWDLYVVPFMPMVDTVVPPEGYVSSAMDLDEEEDQQ